MAPFAARWLVAIALGAFMIVSLLLYLSVDSNARQRWPNYGMEQMIEIGEGNDDDPVVGRIHSIQRRIQALKSNVQDNQRMMKDLMSRKMSEGEGREQTSRTKEGKANGDEQKGVLPAPQQRHSPATKQCPLQDQSLGRNATSDVQMLSLYDVLPFDNPDGGVWKQGWPITYDEQKVRAEKRLEVIVIPHSHNDPGWLKTFEGYFEDQTRHILDLMVKHLDEKPDMKFIYAEMSFFELWWSQQSAEVKERVKKFLDRGQLEIVTGGWVMTDEANAHLYAMIMQLFEGHEFLQNHLGYSPRHHWSIDPFGLSPTMAYLLNRANLTHMAIQRVHYAVKRWLAQRRQLEFVWRQMFETEWSSKKGTRKTDIVTHMFPFYSYDAPHSCGPDPKVCCQFDFRRLGHGPISCPWGVNAVPTTKQNVAKRAALLADQYRKKAQLYGHNTILVPLGDDFRYDVESEWTDQYANYKLLFEHMNSRPEWNINARFGTLGDYFAALDGRLIEQGEEERREGAARHHAVAARSPPQSLPVLSGDFFTYADRDDHYWSGFFTSRPFYKHMDRTLQHHLRAADAFYTLARWRARGGGGQNDARASDLDSLFTALVRARRAMSLFQHHDGVTGTARTRVMADYGEKMAQALADCKLVLARSVQSLLGIPSSSAPRSAPPPLLVNTVHHPDRLADTTVLEEGAWLVVANSLGWSREELVCVHVGSVKARIITGGEKGDVPQQIGPLLFVDHAGRWTHHRDKFELCFVARVPPLGLARFQLVESEDAGHRCTVRQSARAGFESTVFDVKSIGAEETTVSIANAQLNATFDAGTGFLKSIRPLKKEEVGVELSFVHYGARKHDPNRKDPGGDSLSGAYLFLPDGAARPVPSDDNAFVVVSGPVRQYVHVRGPPELGLRHRASLDLGASHLALLNTVNLAADGGAGAPADRGNRAARGANYELAMRVRVPTIREDNFFTDLNGFQMIRRRRQTKLPLQAHFYPMPGAAFIEDPSSLRVSLLGRQALGVASLEPGEIQVVLDRRLVQDDDRGLGQGVEDNRQTESAFHLHIEQFTPSSSDSPADSSSVIAFHSLAAHHSSLRLHYPPMVLAGQLDHATASGLPHSVSGLRRPFPCNFRLLALRTLSQPTAYGGAEEPLATPAAWTTATATTRPRDEAALILHRLALECRLPSESDDDSDNCSIAESLDFSDLFDAPPPRAFRRGSLTLLDLEDADSDGNLAMDPMELATVRVQF